MLQVPRDVKPDREGQLQALQDVVDSIHAIIAKQSPKKLVILFTDDHFIPVPTAGNRFRVSANHQRKALIQMSRYDRESPNMLTHELTHALRRVQVFDNSMCVQAFLQADQFNAVPNRKWHDHNSGKNQELAMSRPTRGDGFDAELGLADTDFLTLHEYLAILHVGYVDAL